MGDTTQTIKKFTFDTEFRGRRDVVSEEAQARVRVSMTHEEIDEMCAKARAEGLNDGQTRAAEKTAAAIEKCAQAVHKAISKCEHDIEIARERATKIALSIARKLAGAALSACPEAEIEQALRTAITQAVGEPRLILRTSRDVAGILTPRMEDLAKNEGFLAGISVIADPAIAPGDCRIEWQDGGLERNQSAIEHAIDELIEQRFALNNMSDRAEG